MIGRADKGNDKAKDYKGCNGEGHANATSY
jgi:hypothetical protein